ncbi:hypothetical protein [Butyrivibrio sp. AD3002]|uniref:hypothetical protein n=1 Tax=Butyrivibrio sp. AD3002 TaxID=1280670 RepID=UPI0003B420C3|nr:hypothetical protein [Butyrivibrio sp. AD3002]
MNNLKKACFIVLTAVFSIIALHISPIIASASTLSFDDLFIEGTSYTFIKNNSSGSLSKIDLTYYQGYEPSFSWQSYDPKKDNSVGLSILSIGNNNEFTFSTRYDKTSISLKYNSFTESLEVSSYTGFKDTNSSDILGVYSLSKKSKLLHDNLPKAKYDNEEDLIMATNEIKTAIANGAYLDQDGDTFSLKMDDGTTIRTVGWYEADVYSQKVIRNEKDGYNTPVYGADAILYSEEIKLLQSVPEIQNNLSNDKNLRRSGEISQDNNDFFEYSQYYLVDENGSWYSEYAISLDYGQIYEIKNDVWYLLWSSKDAIISSTAQENLNEEQKREEYSFVLDFANSYIIDIADKSILDKYHYEYDEAAVKDENQTETINGEKCSVYSVLYVVDDETSERCARLAVNIQNKHIYKLEGSSYVLIYNDYEYLGPYSDYEYDEDYDY